jgi:hypothetical protein
MVGAIYASGMAWLLIGTLGLPWQLFAVVATLPAALASALVTLLLPESPHFLAGAGKVDAARDALCYMARISGKESRLVRGWALAAPPAPDAGADAPPLAAPGSAGADAGAGAAAASFSSGGAAEEKDVRLEGAGSLASAISSGVGGGGARGGSGGALLRGRRRPRLLALASDALRPLRALCSSTHARTATLLSVVWFCISFGWYGLILWLPTLFKASDIELDVYQDAFLVTAANLPGNLVSAFLMDRVGTKAVLAASLVLAAGSAAAFPFARSEATVLLAACSLNAVSTCSWNALDCLSTEAFPSRLRTTSLGLLSASGRVGSIVGQFVFGALSEVSTAALLASAAIALAVGAAAALALPSGRGIAPVFGANKHVSDEEEE